MIRLAGRRGWTGNLAANDESLRGDWRGRRLRLALADDLQAGGVRLVILERAGVALDVIAQRDELVDDLLVVELDLLGFELPSNFMYALLCHTRKHSGLLTIAQ